MPLSLVMAVVALLYVHLTYGNRARQTGRSSRVGTHVMGGNHLFLMRPSPERVRT